MSCVARVELVCYSLQSALARPRIPIGRGSSLKICAVWVRVPPRAPKSPGHTASRWRGANCSLRAFSYSRHRLASRCSVGPLLRQVHGTPHYQVQHYVAPDNELIMKLHYQPRHVVEADIGFARNQICGEFICCQQYEKRYSKEVCNISNICWHPISLSVEFSTQGRLLYFQGSGQDLLFGFIESHKQSNIASRNALEFLCGGGLSGFNIVHIRNCIRSDLLYS